MSRSSAQAPEDGAVRVGVDVGGTFTDVVLVDGRGAIQTLKLPSTPDDFSEGVSAGVRGLIGHGEAHEARDVVHGTTVATNSILERKGAVTGLLTTQGFRDVLELRRLRIPRLYDLTWEKPAPIVPRSLRAEVPERMTIDGVIAEALDLDAVRHAIDALVARGVDSIAICFLHSYANPEHEEQVARLLAMEYPQLWVSVSHRVLPVIREYERTSTTVLNAYVRPVVASYLEALQRKLGEAGLSCPLLIMQSNGGAMTGPAAAELPAYIIESGPAAGVIATAELARTLKIGEAIAFDMGGTTAKASVVEEGRPHFTHEFEVAAGLSASSRLSSGGGYALSVPFIDLAEIGAGGGSLIWIDDGGAPKVGPTSAGADPGPICYGRGGTEPTVTDANLLLGYLNPAGLLDGQMPLDTDAAYAGFKKHIADRLGLGVAEAAYGCHELANASMIRAIKSVTVQRGRDPREFALVAFGGSGPVHAAAIARELSVPRVLIPPHPGVFSAVGLLQARLEFHAKRTFLARTRTIERDAYEARVAELEQTARESLGTSALTETAFVTKTWAEMRYVGQGFELPVPVPTSTAPWDVWRDELIERFHTEHERTYGHRTANPTEIVHLRVVLREADHPPFPAVGRPGRDTREVVRPAYFGAKHGWRPTRVLRRGGLSRELSAGPLVISDYDATTVVPPDFVVRLDGWSNIEILPR